MTETLGSRIKEARRAANITQQKLGDLINVSRVAVANWETDRSNPETGRLHDLARLLGVSVEWLIYGDHDRPGLDTGPIRRDTMRTVLEAVSEFMHRERVDIPPAQFSELVLSLYEAVSMNNRTSDEIRLILTGWHLAAKRKSSK